MFKLFDQNYVACAPIISPYDISISEEINVLKTLDFKVREEAASIVPEGYLETLYGNFVIKEVDKNKEGEVSVHAIQNAEELQGARLLKAEYEDQTIEGAFNILFGNSVGASGWTATFNFPSGNRLLTAKRSNQFYRTSLWEALQDIREQYYAEYWIDEINKKITVYDAAERRLYSTNRGILLLKDLNLAEITIKQDTNDFITTIYPYGKEVKNNVRLNISNVNNGVYYLSNHTYTDKIIREYWVDDKYEPKLYTNTIEATKAKQTVYTLTEKPNSKNWINSIAFKIKTTKNKKTTWTDTEVKSSQYSLSDGKITITSDTLKDKITDGSKLTVKYYTNYGTRAEDLMEDAQIRLNELSTPAISFSITAIDLAKIRGGSSQYELGEILTLRDENLDVKLRIIGKKYNPEEPEATQLTLNSRRKTLDEAQARRKRFVNKLKNNTSNSGSATSVSSNSVSSSSIQAGSVGSDQIVNGSILSLHIGEGEIDSANIRDAAIGSAQIEDAAITTAKIGEAQITSALIEDAAITNAKIATAAVGTANIDNAAITRAHIQDGIIDTAAIATGAIQTAQIADGSVTDAKIVGLTANKITAGTIDAANIDVINLNAANLTVGSINGTQIANGTIELGNLSQTVIDAMGSGGGMKTYFQATAPTEANEGDLWFDTDDGNKLYSYQNAAWVPYTFGSSALSANSITAEHLTSGAVTTGKIAAGAITSSTIATDAITSDKIQANAINTSHINSGAITADKIVSRGITADKIAAATITANEIAANTITSAEIAANTITSYEIDTTQLFSQDITASNFHLTGGSININTGGTDVSRITLNNSTGTGKVLISDYSVSVMNTDAGTAAALRNDGLMVKSTSPNYSAYYGAGNCQVDYIKANTIKCGDYLVATTNDLSNYYGRGDSPYFSSTRIIPGKASVDTCYISTTTSSGGYRLLGTSDSLRAIKNSITEDLSKDENLNPEHLYDLPVVLFKYNEGYYGDEVEYDYNQYEIGFIAEDMDEFYPKAAVYRDGKLASWTDRNLIPPMLKLIQDQHKQIEDLTARVAALEEKQ